MSMLLNPFLTAPVDPAISMAAVFTGGRKGWWHDPSDASTRYQTNATTTPTTTDGQTVGYLADKAGNTNHMQQATAGSRPLYKTNGTLHWLLEDGVDDHLFDTSVDLSAATRFVVGVAFQKADDTEVGHILHLFVPGNSRGAQFNSRGSSSGTNEARVIGVGGGGTSGTIVASATVGEDVVLVADVNLVPGDMRAWKNGTLLGTLSGTLVASANTMDASSDVYLGQTSAIGEFNGRIYGSVGAVVTDTTDADTVQAAFTAWLKAKAGVA